MRDPVVAEALVHAQDAFAKMRAVHASQPGGRAFPFAEQAGQVDELLV